MLIAWRLKDRGLGRLSFNGYNVSVIQISSKDLLPNVVPTVSNTVLHTSKYVKGLDLMLVVLTKVKT